MKLGRIRIGSMDLEQHPDTIRKIFSDIGFLPTSIDETEKDLLYTYIGLSESFRDLSKYEYLPLYQTIFDEETNSYSVSEVFYTKITCNT